MILIPTGQFMMGSDRGPDADERPAHRVAITRPFYLDEHEVTRGDYQECVNAGVCVWPLKRRRRPIQPLGRTQRENWGLKYCGAKALRTPRNHPLTCVNYYEARHYCEEWRGGRLPTEAEWEWAGRGGLKKKRYAWGNERPTRKRALYGKYTGTARVGSYPPNGYGLYDMAGNVWEWTSDWYHASYYTRSPYADPTGPCAGKEKCNVSKHRTMRGGSWITGSMGLRITYRNHHRAWNRFTVVGVRCAHDASASNHAEE